MSAMTSFHTGKCCRLVSLQQRRLPVPDVKYVL